jgi:hypothetical protein
LGKAESGTEGVCVESEVPAKRSPSPQPIIPTNQKLQQPQVAPDLSLLTDFGLHVSITWMQTHELAFERINLAAIEFRFPQRANHVQNVECPPALFRFQFLKRSNPSILCANLGRRGRLATCDYRNSRIQWNRAKKDVASLPAGAARIGTKRSSLSLRRLRHAATGIQALERHLLGETESSAESFLPLFHPRHGDDYLGGEEQEQPAHLQLQTDEGPQ